MRPFTGGGNDMSDVCMLSKGPSTKQSWSCAGEDAQNDTEGYKYLMK